MSTLYLIGGTGGLGSQIAKGLITAEGFSTYKAIVRDESKAQSLKELGWTIVTVQSIESISAADLSDAKVVVSTLGGSNIVTMESAIIKAAKEAGTSLFVPSQFGIDYRRWGSSFPLLAAKKEVLDFAVKEGLPTLAVFTGFFSDIIFDFLGNPVNGKVTMVGDGLYKISFTRRSDIGFVLAKALNDSHYNQGGCLSMNGDSMLWKDALDLYANVSGVKFEVSTMDPQEALKEEQDLLQKGLKGDMGSFLGAFALHLIGEPARGNPGCDLTAEATTLGVKMETLEETLQDVYGKN